MEKALFTQMESVTLNIAQTSNKHNMDKNSSNNTKCNLDEILSQEAD